MIVSTHLPRSVLRNTTLCRQPLLADGAQIDRRPTAEVACAETGSDPDRDYEGAEDECDDSHTLISSEALPSVAPRAAAKIAKKSQRFRPRALNGCRRLP